MPFDTTAHSMPAEGLGDLPKAKVIGAYSIWPRSKPTRRRRLVRVAGAVTALGIFAHCVLPMLLSA